MTISGQLEAIASSDDFAGSTAELAQAWSVANVGAEAIEPILRFIEMHPELDYGMPGPLVHFLENFYLSGYEDALIESVSRRPTALTVWMLNRVLNGIREPAKRRVLLQAMRETPSHPKADNATIERTQGFLNRLER